MTEPTVPDTGPDAGPDASPDAGPSRRLRATFRALGWPAVLVATVLAVLAAAAVLVLLGDADEADTVTSAPTGSLELTPADEVGQGDPLSVPFTTQDGGEQTLTEVLEGPTVVNFFASWCAPCVKEMPDFQDVSQELDGRVAFFGLAVNDRPEDARRIVEQTGVTYDWGRDVEGRVANAAGALNMPTTMFVDADGEVVEVHSGALDADQLRALIDEHLGVQA